VTYREYVSFRRPIVMWSGIGAFIGEFVRTIVSSFELDVAEVGGAVGRGFADLIVACVLVQLGVWLWAPFRRIK
jgi:hypothetical protein